MASARSEATRPPITAPTSAARRAQEQARAAAQHRGDPPQHDAADQGAGQRDQHRVVAAGLGHGQAKEPDRQGGRRGKQPRNGGRQPLPSARRPHGRSPQPRRRQPGARRAAFAAGLSAPPCQPAVRTGRRMTTRSRPSGRAAGRRHRRARRRRSGSVPRSRRWDPRPMRTGSCSQSCQPAGTYQRCQSWPSCPRANTSMRSGPQEQAVGFPVSSPPCAMPFVPGGAVPVDVPQLAIAPDGEDLHLVGGPAGDRRRRGQLAAQ